MSLKERTINVDIMTKEYTKLKYKQGEAEQNINVKLFKNGEQIDLIGLTISAFFEKPNGEILEKAATFSNDSAVITLSKQILNAAGEVKVELFITKGEELVISFTIMIDVEESINASSAVEEKEEWDSIKDLLIKSNNLAMIDDNNVSNKTTSSSYRINSQLEDIKNDFNSQIKEKANKAETNNLQQQLNNLVLGAVGDGNNAEVIQARGEFDLLNNRLDHINKMSYNNGFISSRITDVMINNDNNNNITVDIISSNGSLQMWRYNYKGANENFYTIDNIKVSYTIPNWNRLIWNLESNTFEITDGVVDSKNILLLNNSNGKADSGYFCDLKRYFDGCILEQKPSIYFSYLNTVYFYIPNEEMYDIDISSGRIYFKFEGNMVIHYTLKGVTYSQSIAFNDLKSKLPEYVKDTPEGVKDCINVPCNKKLVFNITTEEYSILDLGASISARDIVLIENCNSYMGGNSALLGIYQNNKFMELKNKENRIPRYYKEHIIAKENSVLYKMNENTVNFFYTSDNHIQEAVYGYSMISHNIMNYLKDRLSVTGVLNAGDSILYGFVENNTKYGLDALKLATSKYKGDNYLIARGNHDCQGYISDGKTKSNLITNIIQYNCLGKHLDNEVCWGSKSNFYYYKDFEEEKIRIIVLNTSDIPWIDDETDNTKLKYDVLSMTEIRQDQINWLANTALNFNDKQDKTEWHTLIMSHSPILGHDEGMTSCNPMGNRFVVLSILEAFKNGTSVNSTGTGDFQASINHDFSIQGSMNLIGVMSGHIHLDKIIEYNGINNITILADYPNSKWSTDDPTRDGGTVNEIAFDVLTIDKLNKNVKLTRFGAGEDREFNY